MERRSSLRVVDLVFQVLALARREDAPRGREGAECWPAEYRRRAGEGEGREVARGRHGTDPDALHAGEELAGRHSEW